MNSQWNGSALDTPEVRRAQLAVDASRRQVDSAFDELEVKLQRQSDQIQGKIDTSVDRAREISDKVRDIYSSITAPKRFAKENPYASVAFFFVAGFIVVNVISKIGKPKIGTTDAFAEPLPGERGRRGTSRAFEPSGHLDLGHRDSSGQTEYGQPISPFAAEEPSRGMEAENIGSSSIGADPDQD